MSTTEESKAVVQRIYDAVMAQDMDTFGSLLHPDLRVSSAPYFAHGGPDSEVPQWQAMLAGLAPVLAIEGISLVSLFGEGEQVAATVRAPLREDKGEVLFHEVWQLRDGKAYRMRVYCYDPAPLLAALEEATGDQQPASSMF
jgi:ketosteroid isomerase-like protein